jgi:ABC-2 type transport system ATP-binding protein
MAGGSYGGGIQLVAASMDKRIDAIVPVIAWHSLATSLMRNDTVKSGWDIPLYAAAAAVKARLNPFLAQSAAMAARAFEPSARERRFFAARGPGRRVARITAPTLLVQGTVDTLFTLREAVTNDRILHRHGVPVKMLWFCGGHGVCLTDPGDEMRMRRDTIAWFDRWLKGRGRVSTGPGFEWLDQRGRSWHAPRWPPAGAGSLTGSGSGTLTLVAEGGSGPADVPPGAQGIPSGSLAAAKASNAVDVTVRAGRRRSVIVGAPRLTLRYHGLAPKADARVLAQVVDDRSGVVLGNQITPIPVTLDGRPHAVTLPLEIVAATARPGERFTLQLVAQSTLYDAHPAGGSVTFDRVHVALPVVKRARPG